MKNKDIIIIAGLAAAAYLLYRYFSTGSGEGFTFGGGGGSSKNDELPLQLVPPPGGETLPIVNAPYSGPIAGPVPAGTKVAIVSTGATGTRIVAKTVVPATAPYQPREKTTFSLTPTPVPRIVNIVAPLKNIVDTSAGILQTRAMRGSKPAQTKIITPVPRIVNIVPALKTFVSTAQKVTYNKWRGR